MTNQRSEKECRSIINEIHKASDAGKRAISYVRSHYDTDYISDITELWLIETYLAGNKASADERSVNDMFDQIPVEKNARALLQLFKDKIAERKKINDEFGVRIDKSSPNAEFLEGEYRGIRCELLNLESWLKSL